MNAKDFLRPTKKKAAITLGLMAFVLVFSIVGAGLAVDLDGMLFGYDEGNGIFGPMPKQQLFSEAQQIISEVITFPNEQIYSLTCSVSDSCGFVGIGSFCFLYPPNEFCQFPLAGLILMACVYYLVACIIVKIRKRAPSNP